MQENQRMSARKAEKAQDYMQTTWNGHNSLMSQTKRVRSPIEVLGRQAHGYNIGSEA